MAQRRMFAKTIIDSDDFLDMPATAQLLYFHLAMRADDDGFINQPKSIMRMTGCKDDDMKLLIGKKYIIPFETGIVVIKHWKIHNYIAKDRYTETKYKEERSQLFLDDNNAYTTCIQNCIQPVDEMETQDRLGKDRLGKDRLGNSSVSQAKTSTENSYNEVISLYNETCCSFPKVKAISESRKKAIKARMGTYTLDDFQLLFEKAEASDFLKGKNNRNWIANFDWLIKDGNMAKALEGLYDNKKSASMSTNRTSINGIEYEVRNGKYYIPNGSGVEVNPFAEDDLPF